MTWRERERAFYVGAPLAIVPALGLLPAVVFLVLVPRFPHAGWIAAVALPVLALTSSYGLWRLSLGAVEEPFGILNALSVGALIVLLIIAAYTGFLLAMVVVQR